MGTWVGSGRYLEEIFQHRGRYAAVALSLRRRGRVQRARLRTAEREGFIDSRERPDTAPPDPTPVVGHGPFPPEAAVLAGLDPAEERGGSSHPPRGDAVIGLGASQRERAGRGRAGTAPQHDAIYFTASRQELEHTAARRGDPAASTRRPRVCADRRTSFRWTGEVKTRLEGPSTVRRALTRLRRDTRPSSPVHLLNGWRSSRGQPRHRLNRLDRKLRRARAGVRNIRARRPC